ncbi:hypothetical protein DPMN_050255 [Dreissena polymorpha]|uniref:Uncharacterized protein n=1 Tax=Dreissena polymorpha TaxID=45954 RepID=A0A9D4HP36_DREPO|nr:hypothetical protein DPMN_050255 [Dreissena polymorpha]
MDVKSEHVQNLLAVCASIYVSISGPYWKLVTSAAVPHLQLYSYIQNLETFLQKCIGKPSVLLDGEPDWCGEEFITGYISSNNIKHMHRIS